MVVGTKSDHNVNVFLNLFDKNFGTKMQNVSKSINEVNKRVSQQAHEFSNLNRKQRITRNNTEMNRVANQGFFQTMRMGQEGFKKFNEQGRRFNTIGGRTANAIRRGTHGLRGFRMEMLGVMFFGMAMQRTFAGLLRTSLEWTGVFEVLTTAMGILFLPVAEMILGWALKFLDFVSNLTKEQKLWIGQIVLLGAALGGLLFIIGTFALGIGSLIIAFKFLFSPITLVLGLLLGLVGLSFSGMFSSLNDELDGTGDKLATFGITGETLSKIKEKIVGLVNKVKDTFVEKWPELKEKGKELLQKIFDGIHENRGKIGETLEKVITSMISWISENTTKIVDIGISIAGHVMKGLIIGIKDFFLLNPGVILGAIAGGIIGSIGGPAGIVAGATAGGALGAKQTIIPSFVPPTPADTRTVGTTTTPSGGINISPVYNVNVSDKSEFERMLERNNEALTSDVRRLIKL